MAEPSQESDEDDLPTSEGFTVPEEPEEASFDLLGPPLEEPPPSDEPPLSAEPPLSDEPAPPEDFPAESPLDPLASLSEDAAFL